MARKAYRKCFKRTDLVANREKILAHWSLLPAGASRAIQLAQLRGWGLAHLDSDDFVKPAKLSRILDEELIRGTADAPDDNALLPPQKRIHHGEVSAVAGREDIGIDIRVLIVLENVSNSIAELEVRVVSTGQIVVYLIALFEILLHLTGRQALPVRDCQGRPDPADSLGGRAEPLGEHRRLDLCPLARLDARRQGANEVRQGQVDVLVVDEQRDGVRSGRLGRARYRELVG